MTKTVKRRLSLILAIILAFCWLPVSGSAQQLTETPEIVEPADVEIAGNEVVALRDETTKHYDMGNGVFQAVSYGHPVHELDENGQWQDIDFSLSLNQTRGVGVYTNEAAGISFPATYQRNQPVMSLSEGGHSVAMTLQPGRAAVARASAAKVTAEVSSPQRSFQTVEEANSAQFSNTVIYSGVLPGVDLEYIVDPGTVKENIIVKEKADSYRYAFTLELTGLTPVQQPDGGIILYAEGTDEEYYVIPTPYMYDALGSFSDAVAYTLSGDASPYTLTVTADAEWINEADRGFPVTIDPSVVKTTGITYDTFIDSGFPDSTRATATELWVRENRIPFIKTQTPSLPANTALVEAKLTAFYFYNDNITSGSVNVSAHQVTFGNWQPGTLTWNGVAHLPNFGVDTDDQSTVTAYAGGAFVHKPRQVDFDIKGAVQSWVDGTADNFGIALMYDKSSPNLSVIFKSYEGGYDTRPRIVYKYRRMYEFISYYDSSMSSEQIANISTAVDFACDAYASQFGGVFYSNSAPSYRGDLADDCGHGPYVECEGGGCSAECTTMCSSDCKEKDNHHAKDTYYISNKLYGEIGSSQERIIYWTDRSDEVYCNHDEGYHKRFEVQGLTTLAVVFGKRPVIHIVDLLGDSTRDQQLAIMGLTLIHEAAHTLGLDENSESAGHSGQCVMIYFETPGQAESFYNAIKQGTALPFCTDCEGKLNSLFDAQSF